MRLHAIIFVVFILSTIICTQNIVGNNTDNAQHFLEQTEESDNICLQKMREITSPAYLAELWSMVSMSGKGINDLGNPDQCDSADLDYVLLTAMVGGLAIRLGLCSPRECNTGYYYANIIETIQANLAASTVTIAIPSEVESGGLSTGASLVIALLAFIVMLWIAGIIVQYSKIGNKPTVQNGNNENQKIEEKKNRCAMFFISWSPIINLQKLLYIKEGGDQSLAVLNGVRVLSICWVIVGHGFAYMTIGAVKNLSTFSLLMEGKLFGIIPGGFYAVDSFFFLSGMLTFLLLTEKLFPKRGWAGGYKTFLIYFHRFYRLIFPIVFVTLIAMYLMKYLGSGPMYR
jgi:hypothetical protein